MAGRTWAALNEADALSKLLHLAGLQLNYFSLGIIQMGQTSDTNEIEILFEYSIGKNCLNLNLVHWCNVAANNFLKVGDDFVWKFGTTRADPDSKNIPRFAGQIYFRWWWPISLLSTCAILTEAKGFDDPRGEIFMYRQSLVNSTNSDEIVLSLKFAPPQYLVGNF